MPPEIVEAEDLKTTRKLLGDILVAFPQVAGVSEGTLKALHRDLNHETVGGDFFPHKRSTWEQLFFKANARKWAYLPKSKAAATGTIEKWRIDLIAEVARRILGRKIIDEVTYDDLPTWPAFLTHVLHVIKTGKVDEVLSAKTPLAETVGGATGSSKIKSADLRFIGGDSEGLKKFVEVCEGSTFVYNTVFTRSEEPFGYLDQEMPGFQEAQRKLLDTGRCVWIDIVESSETDAIVGFYESLSPRQKAKYHPHRLQTESKLPLLQCLVMRANETRGSVMVGWPFSGMHKSRVYFSDHPDTCNYFFEYCEMLKKHCIPLIQSKRPASVRSKRRSGKKITAKSRRSK
jgi:hypothetical protein